MTTAELLTTQLDDTRAWTLKLIADLDGNDWFFQPAPGMGHALWLCGHLTCSQHLLIHVRCLSTNGVLDDAFTSHFPIGSPVASRDEHDYPPIEAVRAAMDNVHRQTIEVVRGMSDKLLAEPAYAADGKSPHPHYLDKCGAVTHCFRHEAFHAGQVASIRRLLGKSFLR